MWRAQGDPFLDFFLSLGNSSKKRRAERRKRKRKEKKKKRRSERCAREKGTIQRDFFSTFLLLWPSTGAFT
jgi:hypothetical protein